MKQQGSSSGKHRTRGPYIDPHLMLQKWLPTIHQARVSPDRKHSRNIYFVEESWELAPEAPPHFAQRPLAAFNPPNCLYVIFTPSSLPQKKEDYTHWVCHILAHGLGRSHILSVQSTIEC